MALNWFVGLRSGVDEFIKVTESKDKAVCLFPENYFWKIIF
jgi:hypothetical protein